MEIPGPTWSADVHDERRKPLKELPTHMICPQICCCFLHTGDSDESKPNGSVRKASLSTELSTVPPHIHTLTPTQQITNPQRLLQRSFSPLSQPHRISLCFDCSLGKQLHYNLILSKQPLQISRQRSNPGIALLFATDQLDCCRVFFGFTIT